MDPGNGRVVVGTTTPLPSDTTPALHVVGRLYVAPEAAGDLALQLRRSAAASVGWGLGVGSTSDLLFKDDGGAERFRVGDAAAAYAATVSGSLSVTGDADVAGDASAERLSVGTTTFSGAEELRVVGDTRLEGALVVTTGGLSATGSSVFNSGLTVLGGLTVSTGGASITGALSVVNSGTKIDVTSSGVGFNGQAGASPPNYTVNSYTTVARTINQGTSSTAEVREVLAQVIIDLIAVGIFQ